MRSRINPSGEPAPSTDIGGSSLTLKHHRGYSNSNNNNKVGVESSAGMRGVINNEEPQDPLLEEAILIVNEQNDDDLDDYDEYEDDPLSYMLDGGCCVSRINREDGDQSGLSCDDIFHYFKRHVVDVAMEQVLHFDFLTWRKTNEEEEVTKLYRKIVFKAQARERGDPAMLFYHVIKNDIHKLITKLDELEAFAIREVTGSVHREEDLSQMGPVDLQERVMDRMRTLVCAADVAGANIIHLAYLFKNYDIGHYLVRRFPMWAYLPYSPKMLSNRYVHRPQDAAVFAFNHEMKVLIDRLKMKLGVRGEDLQEKLESLMLYTGENILHMVIVHRDYNQVRWLLDFYRDRMHPFPLGLLTLLSQPATGAFFDQRTGDIYFGSTPLQFAVCSNDQEIFKLVYSCCAGVDERASNQVMKETGSGKIIESTPESSSKEQPWSHNFGAYAVFQTDSEGNNALHLCALHGLSDMYQCVYDTALSLVSRELRNEYVKKSSINPSTKKNVTIHLNDKILAKNCATMRLKDISIPINCNDLDKRIDAEAQRIVDYKLVLALNRDLHSPLTLTAATMIKPPRHDILNSEDDSSDENNPSNKYHKKVDMFRILLQKLKKRQWSYGPISLYYLTLDGVAMNYKVKDRYEVATDDDHQRRPFSNDQMKNSSTDQQTTFSSMWKLLTHCFDSNVNAISGSRLKNNRMLPAIAWLCVNETEKAILIPEIVEIIETKWRLMAYPTFLSSFILHLVLTLMITVALCLMNSTSTLNFGSDYSLDIIISIILIIIGASYLFLIVKQFNAYLRRGRDFFDLRGICLFDRRMRFVKVGSFVSFCICKYLMIRERYYRDDFSSPYGIVIYYDKEYQEGAMISLAVCAMVSWLHLYFFLMGFDGTGPLTLTIFRLCTVDVPYFLKFYCVVILSYASALGVLAMSGMSDHGPTFGFMFILRSIGSLIQVTVGVDPTKDVLNIQTAFSSEFFWLAELLLTSYNAVVLILMINLLIAIISQTFDRYFNKSYPLLLMAKYDIMHAMEKSMGVKELNETSEKYAASDDAANQEFARDDDDDRLMRTQIKSFKFQMKEHNTNWYYTGREEVSTKKKSMRNALLIIDAQNDFHEGGLLPINGATEDSRRVAELIRKFGSNIHEIYVSLSAHHPKYIANASCWKRGAKKATSSEENSVDGDGYAEGDHPRPFTEISYQDIRAGKWLYQFKDLRSIEMTNKFRIQVLPEHCIVGTHGHCLHPVIHDAIQGWTQRSSRNVHYIFKGHHLFIEVRSALCHPTDPDASHNEDLLAKLKMNDKLFICGQAMSHCVNHTTRDLIDKWGGENLVLLKDGTSSFEGFKSQSEAFLHYAKQKGVTVVACEGAFEGYEPDDSMAMDEHKLLLSNTEPTTVAKAVKKRVVKKITAAAISLSAFKPISIIDS